MGFSFNITDQNVIETYSDGIEKAKIYRNVMSKADSGKKYSRIARECETNANKVRRYLVEGRIPDCIKGVNFLEERGLLPLDLSSESAALFNVFTALWFFGGSISHRYEGWLSPPRKNSKRDVEYQIMKKVVETLGVNTAEYPDKDIPFSKYVSRMFVHLGHTPGSKKQSALVVPNHIDKALDFLVSSEDEKEESEKVVDMMRVFFHTFIGIRLSSLGESKIAYLNSYEDAELAVEHGQKMCKMANETYPQLRTELRGPFQNRDGNKKLVDCFRTRLVFRNTEEAIRISESLRTSIDDLLKEA